MLIFCTSMTMSYKVMTWWVNACTLLARVLIDPKIKTKRCIYKFVGFFGESKGNVPGR
jgi:hypothetical protein